MTTLSECRLADRKTNFYLILLLSLIGRLVNWAIGKLIYWLKSTEIGNINNKRIYKVFLLLRIYDTLYTIFLNLLTDRPEE